MDIFGNIQRLNAENIDYINNIEKEIKSVEAKVNEILDSRHMRMYEFLEERVNLVKEMFPNRGIIRIKTGFPDVTIEIGGRWYYDFAIILEDEMDGLSEFALRPSYVCTTEKQKKGEVQKYNQVITNWDSMQEEIFDEYLYKILSEMMAEDVLKATERLEKAQQELSTLLK